MAEQQNQQTGESPESLIAAGLSKGPAATSGTAGATETAKPAETPATEQLLTKDQVSRMIAEAIDKDRVTRGAEDARLAFLMNEASDLPAELYPLIPKTEDRHRLFAAVNELEKGLQKYIDVFVKRGTLKRVDVGMVNPRGLPPSRIIGDEIKSPVQLIQEGLR